MKKTDGLIQIYTGDGKGKTTAAIGQAIRALGNGLKVCFIQFFKKTPSGEIKILKKLGIETILSGIGFFKILGNKNPPQKHKKVFQKAFKIAKEKISSGKYDLIILDELCLALSYKLIGKKEVISLLGEKPKKLDLILTGRGAPLWLTKLADLVTQMKKIKHPFDKGVGARKGIEY